MLSRNVTELSSILWLTFLSSEFPGKNGKAILK